MMVSTKQRAQSIQIASTSANEESNTSSPDMGDSALKQDILAQEAHTAEAADQKDLMINTDFSVVYDYWKNFDIKKLQDDLNNQIEKMNKYVHDLDKINSCFLDMNMKLASLIDDEDAFKTVSPIVNLLQTEIDSLSSRTKENETTCTHLFKLLANVPDPFPVIEQVKSSKANKQINRLQLENKTLKDKINLLEKELTRVRNAEADNKEKELIVSLSEQITNTMAMNIDLTSKLKINEGELESYKKLLSDYKAQLSEMKCKQINEIKSEILKENDKLKLNQTPDLAFKTKRSRSPSLNNGQAPSNNLKNLLDMSKETGKCNSSSSSSSSSSISSTCTKHLKSEPDNANDYDSSNETDNDENVLNTSNLSPSSSAYEPLNTADVAQKVRDLLSAHNIGQRVFAKCILGLSQGTVSELLSKPKHWDKLTEKGRESYRKMYNWSLNENSINSLKAISPKKGNKETSYLQLNTTNASKEDSATLERIAQILYDAQKKIKSENFSSPMSPSSSNSESSPLMSPVCDQKASQNDEHDSDENETALDLTISKNAKKRKLNSNETSSDDEDTSSNMNEYESTKRSNLLNTTLNNQLGLNNLNQFSPFLNPQLTKKFTSLLNQSQAGTLFMQQQQQQLQQLQQQMMPSQPFTRATSTPSPSPSLNTSTQSTFSNKPLKCVLPPVSQEQFDKYSQINTEELVKKVKDLLSKFSISQRLFGECILGLSQGSVSDLLARPKPWVMLTQKGREPFIRMQMFIDDPDSIKKLMANQYKTPMVNMDKRTDSNNNLLATVNQNIRNMSNMSNIQNVYSAKSVNDSSNDSEARTPHVQSQINIIPYDISALSGIGELNTDEITNRVKETLMNNNIGQKLFGEAVLNLSQGTVSELLSKPKPWNTLSIKGREPYLRMYMWLNDPIKLEKLSEWKEERNLQKKNCTQEVETHDQQKPKRRFIFSEEQKDQLMKAFKYDPYPAVNQMEQLAAKLGLQTRTVINWFHNHRMRIRYKNTQSSTSSNSTSLNDISSLSNTLHSRAKSFNAGLTNLKFQGVLEQLNKMTDKTNFLNLLANVQNGSGGGAGLQAQSNEEESYEDEDENQNQSYQEYNEENNEADMQFNDFGEEQDYDYEQQNEEAYEDNLDDDEDDEHSVNLPSNDLNRNKRRKPHNPQKLSNVNENLIKKASDVDPLATS